MGGNRNYQPPERDSDLGTNSPLLVFSPDAPNPGGNAWMTTGKPVATSPPINHEEWTSPSGKTQTTNDFSHHPAPVHYVRVDSRRL